MDVMLVQYMLFKVCINGLPHFNKQVGFTPVAPDVSGRAPYSPSRAYTRENWIAGSVPSRWRQISAATAH